MKPIRRLCIQWPRLGPYHLARLRAAHAFVAERGVDLVALETARQDALYDWEEAVGEEAFAREQVFTDRVFEEIPPATLYDGVTAALDRLQPDAVAINSYSYADAQACLAWCRRNRRVAVVMTDSKADDAPRSAWREALKRAFVREFDAALVAGTPQRAYVNSLGLPDEVIFTGYDVVDNALFAREAEAARRQPLDEVAHLPGLDDPTSFFLVVSRLIPLKNLDRLLRAYARYREQALAPWRLVILGDGPLRSELECLIQDLELEGVHLPGFVQASTITTYYGRAEALIHPTSADTWGLVVNEAMASALPVIVSTAAGCAVDLVEEEKSGYTFSPGDTAKLAAVMKTLSAPETDRAAMGAYAQEIIASYTPETFARNLWAAVEAGQPRVNRPFSPLARLLLWVLRRPRDPRAFHTHEV